MKIALWRAWTDADDRRKDVPSLGLTSIVAHARHAGHEIEARYCEGAPEMLSAEADVYAISSDTSSWPETLKLCRWLVQHGKTVIIGGPHVTCLPEAIPSGCTGVLGEGERAFSYLLNSVAAGRPLPRRAPAFDRLALQDCNHLPVCVNAGGHLHAVASRGCLYKCWFCTASRCWPGKVTRFSAEHVATSIGRHFIGRAPGLVTFQDLHFASDPEYTEQVCHGLAHWGAPEKFRVSGCSFSAILSRDPERCRAILQALKSVGLGWIGIGIESASPRLFNKLKPHLELADNERLIEIAADVGVTVHASFIVGIPGETDADLQATLDFIKSHTGPAFKQSGLFMYGPYPGTPGWTQLQQHGVVSPDMDFGTLRIGANPATSPVFYANEAMPFERMLKWRKAISAAGGG